ncbi:MAG: histidinol dehydrogenase [Bacillota bacterium]|nr:histidinol dehydrogenase [Bacillota bacterium]
MIKIIKEKNNRKFIQELNSRSAKDYKKVIKEVEKIVNDVKINGDKALKKYAEKFDGLKTDNFMVSQEEIELALNNIDKDLLITIENAYKNVYDYHKRQKRKTTTYKPQDKDIILGQIIKPIKKAGIYVPGGKAAYPSTVIMNAVPAKIAGVEELIMITPVKENGKVLDSILAAASICGVDKIYKIGGAHGIAALAYGTESVPKVFKITGPGNIYVSAAKKIVSEIVGIDMIAGPSEILIVADKNANPKYIAADLISQAEHDEMAASILVTDSYKLAEKVSEYLEIMIDKMSRKEIISKSIDNYGGIILTDSLNESLEIANEIAPEHLEILTVNPFEDYKKVDNAGAIFLGEFSPEPVGDYYAGPNHTLPTNGTSKFSSPLSVDDFIKKTSLIYYSKESLEDSKDDIIRFAENEGLSGHAQSIKIRFEE